MEKRLASAKALLDVLDDSIIAAKTGLDKEQFIKDLEKKQKSYHKY